MAACVTVGVWNRVFAMVLKLGAEYFRVDVVSHWDLRSVAMG